MNTKLSAMVQATIDALLVAEAHTASLSRTMRRLSVSFGPEYEHIEEDLARLLEDLHSMRYLAEQSESN
jgi:hypothetical protein